MELYKLLIKNQCKPPTSITSYENKFRQRFDWQKIYMLPRYSCIDSFTRIFQFKILHSILFLNNRLFHLNLSDTKLCCLCKLDNETPEHLFSRCGITSGLWTALQNRLTNAITLGPLTPQSATLGFLDLDPNISNVVNQLLLIFKCFIYKYRKTSPTANFLFEKIKSRADIEKKACEAPNKLVRIIRKWENIVPLL